MVPFPLAMPFLCSSPVLPHGHTTTASWWKTPAVSTFKCFRWGFGGGGVLGKGLGKTQIPFRAPGNRRQTKKPHLLQRHSGLLKICSKLVFYTRKWSCTPCRAALENIAWFWSSMAGLRITVITRLLGFFIQMLPFPGLHGKTWPEELGVLAEDMEVHMDSWDVCSPQQRSNWLQLESWDMPAPRPNPGFQACTSGNEGRSQPWEVDWHHMK